METNNLKKQAISVLKSIKPESNVDVINIIENIRNCYFDSEGYNKTYQTSNVKFLIDELNSFIDGIKG